DVVKSVGPIQRSAVSFCTRVNVFLCLQIVESCEAASQRGATRTKDRRGFCGGVVTAVFSKPNVGTEIGFFYTRRTSPAREAATPELTERLFATGFAVVGAHQVFDQFRKLIDINPLAIE